MKSTNLSPKDRKRVLDWADEVYPNIKQEKFSTWETIRRILNHHRSHPDTDWALPESELVRLDNLYNILQPTDIIHRYIWLFNEHSPEFPEGFKYEPNELEKRYKQQQKRIDEALLQDWIIKSRTSAKSASRLNVADFEIGKVLAQYPENISLWPQEIIFQIIEEINTDSLKSSYSSAMFNKRGLSTRGAFDGGDIERDKAAYFEKLANDCENKYPSVAEIFKQMQQRYLADAKRMDEEAERNRLEY